MLEQTFRHIPGIGPATEEKIWAAGIRSWSDYLDRGARQFSGKRYQPITAHIERSQRSLSSGDIAYFTRKLRTAEHWRIFPHHGERVAYLDIETTGLDHCHDHITTIAIWDGTEISTYIHGRDLDDFADDIQQYDLIVTFNGKTFDIPFIEHAFGTAISTAHLDLRYILKSINYRGGLKSIETQLGIARGGLDGVDGFTAVLLWKEYLKHQDEAALETLLAYNIEDVVHLEWLMTFAYNRKLASTPFVEELKLPLPELERKGPYQPDRETLERVLKKQHRFGPYGGRTTSPPSTRSRYRPSAHGPYGRRQRRYY